MCVWVPRGPTLCRADTLLWQVIFSDLTEDQQPSFHKDIKWPVTTHIYTLYINIQHFGAIYNVVISTFDLVPLQKLQNNSASLNVQIKVMALFLKTKREDVSPESIYILLNEHVTFSRLQSWFHGIDVFSPFVSPTDNIMWHLVFTKKKHKLSNIKVSNGMVGTVKIPEIIQTRQNQCRLDD